MTLGFIDKLLDTSGFPPRWHCGMWTSAHGWLHILSDIGIWSAYFTIPIMFWWLIAKRNRIRFRGLFVLFALFIFLCGSTHLMEAIIFWWPAYRLAGMLKFLTAIFSWATVVALVRIAPAALGMRTHEELEREVFARQEAERRLRELNEQLEVRVQERVNELAIANAELHQQRDWFRTTLASIGDGVISTDAQGSVTMLNDVAMTLTGWKMDQALGQPLETVFHIIHETTRERLDNPAQRALVESVIVGLANHALLIARDGSERPIADSAAPIRDVDGKVTGSVLVFRDVTETRRLEHQYRQSQKMEAIGRFAGGIAHDFNNLLTVINGYCDMLETDCQLSAPCREFLNEVHHAGNRAAALTQQLLAFSRMQMAQPQILDLNDVVTSISRMLQRMIGEDVRMELDLAGDLWSVSADRGQMEQVLVNLAVNARDAMPAGGTIELSTCNLNIVAGNSIHPSDAPPGPYVLMTFSDNGSGMEDAVRERAFEPYFTTKELGKGTGLGLATVFGIVKQSQGFISLNSRPNQGTQVAIYLPRAMVHPAHQTEERRNHEPPGGSETILVVEDDEMVQNLTCHILRSAGYTVFQALNGRQAEELFRGTEKIDLVVSDVVMPEMSGRQLRENLRALRPNLRFLLVSGYTIAESLGPAEATANLDDTLIAKPFSSETLLRKVREALD